MTSVKDIVVKEEPTRTELGRGRFVFTDDYSVFDWGKMPDTIPDKGASLCAMGAFNFERLEDHGVPTHYRGVVDDGDVVSLADATAPPTEMVLALTQVPDLPFSKSEGEYDYETYHAAAGENYLVPLEIVFRNTVPVGSSLRKRGEPADYGLDHEEWPEEAVSLPEPVVEFSTKYEEQDRYLSREEADRIAGEASIEDLEEIAREVNRLVTERAADAGFVHEDGKIECLSHQGTIKVADVVGTFDENRFSYDDQEVSKEVVRQFYKGYQPQWVEAVSEAKAEADRKGIADWKSLCGVEPNPLPDDVISAVRDLYTAGTNAYTGRDFFDAPNVDEAVDRVRDL